MSNDLVLKKQLSDEVSEKFQTDEMLVGWYDAILDAKTWFSLNYVTSNEAAMLLCQLNPDEVLTLPGNTESDLTKTEDYISLNRIFEHTSDGKTQLSLMQWREIAISKGLKYHSWIDNYMKAVEIREKGAVKTVKRVKGMTKQPIVNAFKDVYWNREQWRKYLASPPKWLLSCRVAKGSKAVSATWNPVSIGIALMDKKITIRRLDLVFIGLKDWNAEWQEKSEIFR